MKGFWLSLAGIVVMLLHYAAHGPFCWGLVPGGNLSWMLYYAEIVIGAVGVLWLFGWLVRGRGKVRFGMAILAGGWAIAAVWLYFRWGWRMPTSIHYQGPENLIAFLAVANVAVITHGYRVVIRDSR